MTVSLSPPRLASKAMLGKRPILLALAAALAIVIVISLHSTHEDTRDRVHKFWDDYRPYKAPECLSFPPPPPPKSHYVDDDEDRRPPPMMPPPPPPPPQEEQVPLLRDVRRPPGTVVRAPHRANDLVDSFGNYTQTADCSLSSLTLHEPFEPLCESKDDVLAALSGGGRLGFDAPYTPRGCDMRWFHTDEVCNILSKYSKILLVGDSLLRHVTSAMHLLIRQDMVNGGYTKWQPTPDFDCSCAAAFEAGGCFGSEAWSGTSIWENDPESMSCPRDNSALIEYTIQNRYPIDEDGLRALAEHFPTEKPEKPLVVIVGQGLWSDLEETETEKFIAQVDDLMAERMPWFVDAGWPRLFVAPSAAGEHKPGMYSGKQGNSELMRFEHGINAIASQRGYDFLGTFNMTVQGRSPDGTHAGRSSDLIKAMSIMNWLSMLDVQ